MSVVVRFRVVAAALVGAADQGLLAVVVSSDICSGYIRVWSDSAVLRLLPMHLPLLRCFRVDLCVVAFEFVAFTLKHGHRLLACDSAIVPPLRPGDYCSVAGVWGWRAPTAAGHVHRCT